MRPISSYKLMKNTHICIVAHSTYIYACTFVHVNVCMSTYMCVWVCVGVGMGVGVGMCRGAVWVWVWVCVGGCCVGVWLVLWGVLCGCGYKSNLVISPCEQVRKMSLHFLLILVSNFISLNWDLMWSIQQIRMLEIATSNVSCKSKLKDLQWRHYFWWSMHF